MLCEPAPVGRSLNDAYLGFILLRVPADGDRVAGDTVVRVGRRPAVVPPFGGEPDGRLDCLPRRTQYYRETRGRSTIVVVVVCVFAPAVPGPKPASVRRLADTTLREDKEPKAQKIEAESSSSRCPAAVPLRVVRATA